MSKRDDYVEKLKNQLDDWNEDLGKLEAKLAEKAEPLRSTLEPQMQKVRDGYDGAKQKFREVRDASGDSWERMTGEVEHVWKTLRQSINYFKSQL